MSNQTNTEQNIIEDILSSLSIISENEPDITLLKQEFPLSSLPPDSRERNMHTAYQLMKFTEQMPGGFFIYRADDAEQVLYANAAVLRLYGCDTMDEFIQLTGNSFKGMVHPEDLDAVEESIKKQIEESRYDLDYVEYRIIQKNGAVRWVDDYGHFIHNETTGDIFYVFIADATEKRNYCKKSGSQS